MKIRIGILFILLLIVAEAGAGTNNYCFRVYLKDKGDAGYSTDKPEDFLTPDAVERRGKYGIVISDNDLPIAQAYLDTFSSIGVKPVLKSKWQSTVVVSTSDSLISEQLRNLSIVDSVKWVWKGTVSLEEKAERDSAVLDASEMPGNDHYGQARGQIDMLNGKKLHLSGFRGNGMRVAVIDAGFKNVDRISAFRNMKLGGTYNAIDPGECVFTGDDHGTKVLSCMASDLPGVMVGTAPDATYWLIKSEDSRSEFPIEEDYWAAAVEYADSVGVDVITSSLGYFHFDEEDMNYEQSLLDGRTAFISRSARIASEKGILLFCSAGNEGNSHWEKITFPSDAPGVLTVGSINSEKKKSVFSSTGFTADFRVKPDLVALGTGATVIDANGNVRYANGTSFSTPIVAGLGICLWQAIPELTNTEIIELIQKVSSQFDRPDAELGYGIPDFGKALKKGQKLTGERN